MGNNSVYFLSALVSVASVCFQNKISDFGKLIKSRNVSDYISTRTSSTFPSSNIVRICLPWKLVATCERTYERYFCLKPQYPHIAAQKRRKRPIINRNFIRKTISTALWNVFRSYRVPRKRVTDELTHVGDHWQVPCGGD